MKTVLKMGAAVLALSLMTGASAFAQADQTNTAPANAAPAAQGGMPGSSAMDNQSGQSMPAQGAATPPAAPDQASSPPASGQGDMSASAAAETANTPAGSPPATYPACKHKGEDRCMQEASISGTHHMRHRMMKSKKSTDATPDTSGASAPAAPPAPGQ